MSRRAINGWPADLATITRDIGSLLLMESGLIGFSVVVALLAREWYPAAGFLIAGILTGVIGFAAQRRFAAAPAPQMKHGMVIAAAGWFSVALFGALPLLFTAYLTPPAVMDTYVPGGFDTGEWEPIRIAGTTTLSSLAYFRNPLHAFFESMSGWTGSGLTMAVREPSLPYTVQWWRSLMQYVGGVGVIVLTVSILARPGSGSYALYQSEAREERIHPSIISTVRTVWKILLLYTALSILLLFLAIWASDYGASLPLWEVGWQAVNHAMTGLTTGGFSVTDNSIATYDSPLVEATLLPIMTLGAIAFAVHYGILWNHNVELAYEDLQTRWLFILLVSGVLVLSAQNALATPSSANAFEGDWFGLATLVGMPAADAIRDSTFQWVSALSCTGFQSAPIGRWSAGGKVIVSIAMVIGGAAGSTVGGIKLIRAYTIGRGIRWQFSRVFLPANAVVNLRIGDRHLNREDMEREFSEAALISLLWIVLLVAGSFVLVNVSGPTFSYPDALFEVASAQGNVGLSSGITGPTMHPIAETMFLFNMWIGRLEIIPVLAFFRSILYGLDP